MCFLLGGLSYPLQRLAEGLTVIAAEDSNDEFRPQSYSVMLVTKHAHFEPSDSRQAARLYVLLTHTLTAIYVEFIPKDAGASPHLAL